MTPPVTREALAAALRAVPYTRSPRGGSIPDWSAMADAALALVRGNELPICPGCSDDAGMEIRHADMSGFGDAYEHTVAKPSRAEWQQRAEAAERMSKFWQEAAEARTGVQDALVAQLQARQRAQAHLGKLTTKDDVWAYVNSPEFYAALASPPQETP